MQRQLVISSSIRAIGYDPAERVLEIEFRSGGVYQYFGVPPEVYQEFMGAPSKGKFFEEHLRDEFRYSRAA